MLNIGSGTKLKPRLGSIPQSADSLGQTRSQRHSSGNRPSSMAHKIKNSICTFARGKILHPHTLPPPFPPAPFTVALSSRPSCQRNSVADGPPPTGVAGKLPEPTRGVPPPGLPPACCPLRLLKKSPMLAPKSPAVARERGRGLEGSTSESRSSSVSNPTSGEPSRATVAARRARRAWNFRLATEFEKRGNRYLSSSAVNHSPSAPISPPLSGRPDGPCTPGAGGRTSPASDSSDKEPDTPLENPEPFGRPPGPPGVGRLGLPVP